MFPGSPAPLPPSTPLRAVLQLLPPYGLLGVWLRQRGTPLSLRAAGSRRLLVCADLGVLLRRCERIAVGQQRRVVLLSAAQLIRCRVLEIVLGTPFLPPPALLRELYPATRTGNGVFTVPIGLGSAEEALALCAAARIPVRSSRVAYAAASG